MTSPCTCFEHSRIRPIFINGGMELNDVLVLPVLLCPCAVVSLLLLLLVYMFAHRNFQTAYPCDLISLMFMVLSFALLRSKKALVVFPKCTYGEIWFAHPDIAFHLVHIIVGIPGDQISSQQVFPSTHIIA